jgi:acyl transferase domain-containing protein/NADPH:quinone reductase-like Zn-dependent oxidoreductase
MKALNQLAKTLSSRRSHFNWRSSVVASSQEGLLSALENVRTIKSSPNNQLVFIFTGQGSQYHGMGRELLVLHTSFAQSLYRSQEILTRLGATWSLVDELLCEESKSRINSSELSQPATTAIQIALVDLLRETNVRPAMVLGHSSGEVAAAYAAGILNHKEALTISYHKGFVAGWCKEKMSSKGAMLAVGLGEAEVMPYLRSGQSGRCVVGCVNSPSSVTLSGDEMAIVEMQELLDKDSVFNRRLKVDIAYHSHHMKAISNRFLQFLDSVTAKSPQNSVRFFSSVSGSEEYSPIGADYWVNNLVSQVRFAPALEKLTRMHSESNSDSLVLLEIGPHSALQGPIRQIMNSAGLPSTKWSYNPSLVRNKDAHEAALEMVASLFESGIQLDIPANFSNQGNCRPQERPSVLSTLPSYSWDHSNRYWHESRLSKEYRFRQHAPHDLLGLRLNGTSTIEPVFRHILNVDDFPWLQEHIIDGFALYPGSAFLCMAIEALRQVSKDRGEKREISKYIFHEVSFSKALVIPNSPASIEVLLSLKPSQSSSERLNITWEEFRITSVTADGKWNEHCRGSIRADYRSDLADGVVGGAREQDIQTSIAKERLQAMRPNCRESVTPEDFYGEMRRNGIDYGDTFTIIQDLQLGDHQAIGKVQVPDIKSQHMRPHIIHPAVFDAFMHIVLPLYHRHCSQGPVMLVSIANVSISADILNKPGDELLVACRLTEAGRRHGSVEVSILQEDPQGNLTEVGSLSQEDFCAIGEGGATEKSHSYRSSSFGLPPCYHLDWVPASSLPRVHHEDHKKSGKRVDISCFSDTPMAQSLAKDILSHLEVKWDSRRCAVVPHIPDSMDPDSIHIIVNDASNSLSTLHDSVAVFFHLKSIIWVNISTHETPSLGTSVNGLARVAQHEVEGINSVMLDYHLDDFLQEEYQLPNIVLDILLRCFVDVTDPRKPIDHEYVYWKGDLLVPRLALDDSSNEWLDAKINGNSIEEIAPFHAVDHGIKLQFKTPGLLDSGVFVPIENITSDLGADEVLVKTYAHAVNQIDVVIAQGRGKSSEKMVGEFSGEILAVGSLSQDIYKPGDRVCGWGSLSYTNIARVQRHRVHRVDESISFVEAASIPLAFQTAVHALINIAQLGPSQKILIHGAAGAVGQAAVSIAQYLGAEVYATVGSTEKQQLLMEKMDVPEARIFSSLSTTFADGVLRQTAGRGVDVVLNCSSGDLNRESMSCIADFGYLIDITKSKRSLILNNHSGKNITFVTVDMELLASKRPSQLQATFAKVMALYHEGKLRPITPITTMSIADFSNAFRLAQSQHYSGKIVITSDNEVSVKQIAPNPGPLRLSADGSYVVLGGDETLNHSLCTFLKDHGAKSIVSAMFSGYGIQASSNDWSAFERVQVDVGNETEVLAALACKLGSNRISVMGVLIVEQIPKASIPSILLGRRIRILTVNIAELTKPDY